MIKLEQQNLPRTLKKYYIEKRDEIFSKEINEGRYPSTQQHYSNKNNNANCTRVIEDSQQHKKIEQIFPGTNYFELPFYSTNKPHLFSNSFAYPYCCIGLVIYENAGLFRYCTGSLISGNMILTSAISCFNQESGEQSTNIWYLPAYQEEDEDRQWVKAISMYYNKQLQFLQQEQNFSMYGIAILQLERSLQRQYGYFGSIFNLQQQIKQSNKPKQQNDMQIEEKKSQQAQQNQHYPISKIMMEICGYLSADIHQNSATNIYKNKKYLYESPIVSFQQLNNHFQQGSFQKFEKQHQVKLIIYDIYAGYGQIGSPIYLYNENSGGYYIVGIHLGSNNLVGKQDTQYNKIGLIFTKQLRNLLNQHVCKISASINLQSCGINSFNHHRSDRDVIFQQQNSNSPIIFLEAISNANIKLYNLHGCSLNYNNMNCLGLKCLMDASSCFSNLIWIQLWNNNLGSSACKYLSRCNWILLTRLSLTDNKISGEGLRHLVQGNWPHLSVFSLSNNLISNDAILKFIALANWPQLSILTLSYNRIGSIGILGMCKMMKAKAGKTKGLTWLELYGNRVSNAVNCIKQIYNKVFIYA